MFNVQLVGEYFSMNVCVEAKTKARAGKAAIEMLDDYYGWDIEQLLTSDPEVEVA